MLKKILNIGVSELNDEILNRKIRTSNLIALLSIIILFSFLPLSFYMGYALSLYLIAFFAAASFLNFCLHANKKHQLSFYVYTISGFVYFICSTLTFGLISNLHYFMLVMCMISVLIFDNKLVVKGFIAFSILSFFTLRWYMNDKNGFLDLPDEMAQIQEIVGHIILFLLFIITSIFFIFFKNDNLAFQKKTIQQKEIIEEKNKDITASINYAKRLQEAILPSKNIIDRYLPDSFILYEPKDIVAGDFYWMETIRFDDLKIKKFEDKKKGNSLTSTISELPAPASELILIAAADCTGHGVPGAMVSVVCSNALNRAVKEFGITEPGKILDKVRELVIETFEKSESEVTDGMDISLCSLDKTNNKLQWAGANNSLWIIRNKELTEIKADKQPIGKTYNSSAFTTHNIDLQANDTFFLFTDGYADQFGGPKGKKYKASELKKALIANSHLPLSDQFALLGKQLQQWKGNLQQVDDILIIGISV